MTRKLFAAVLLTFCTVALAQTTFRWTDKEGRVHYSDQPPPADARNVQKKMVGGQYVETGSTSFGLQKATQEFPVTVYTSPDCGAECRVGRELLQKRGVPFTEKSVRSYEDGEMLKKLAGGELAVPVIAVGTLVQKGFEEGAWNKLLDDAGYPKTASPPRPGAPPARP